MHKSKYEENLKIQNKSHVTHIHTPEKNKEIGGYLYLVS